MKILARDIGHDKFIEMLKKASSEAIAEATKKRAQDLPKKDLAAFLAPMKADPYFWNHVLTYEFVEDTEKAAEIKVTECLFAKTFREMDAADIGYVALCDTNFAAAPAFNPKMKMIRAKTLMQGHDCCNHRWIMEG